MTKEVKKKSPTQETGTKFLDINSRDMLGFSKVALRFLIELKDLSKGLDALSDVKKEYDHDNAP